MTDKTALARSIADCDPDLTCAAPELLAALEMVLKMIDQDSVGAVLAKDAIAMARGEQ